MFNYIEKIIKKETNYLLVKTKNNLVVFIHRNNISCNGFCFDKIDQKKDLMVNFDQTEKGFSANMVGSEMSFYKKGLFFKEREEALKKALEAAEKQTKEQKEKAEAEWQAHLAQLKAEEEARTKAKEEALEKELQKATEYVAIIDFKPHTYIPDPYVAPKYKLIINKERARELSQNNQYKLNEETFIVSFYFSFGHYVEPEDEEEAMKKVFSEEEISQMILLNEEEIDAAKKAAQAKREKREFFLRKELEFLFSRKYK